MSNVLPSTMSCSADARLRLWYDLKSAPVVERWLSGRKRLPAKKLSGQKLDRGFESLPLRALSGLDFPLLSGCFSRQEVIMLPCDFRQIGVPPFAKILPSSCRQFSFQLVNNTKSKKRLTGDISREYSPRNGCFATTGGNGLATILRDDTLCSALSYPIDG